MKKFSPEPQAFTPQISAPNEPTSGFDITKLLSILPKLNIGALFGKQTPTPQQAPPAQAPVFDTTQSYINRQNKTAALKNIEAHHAAIQKIRENAQN